MSGDRWHKTHPKPGEPVCREHKLVPTVEHGQGNRWAARWRDQDGVQQKQNFARMADRDAFLAQVRSQMASGAYVDSRSAEVTFRAFAEDWRQTRTHDRVTFDRVTFDRIERGLRLHVYPAIGHRT